MTNETASEVSTAFYALTMPLLKARAKDAGIRGYSRMRKAELVDTLTALEIENAAYAQVLKVDDFGAFDAAVNPGAVPDTVEAWQAYAEKLKASRDSAERAITNLVSRGLLPPTVVESLFDEQPKRDRSINETCGGDFGAYGACV